MDSDFKGIDLSGLNEREKLGVMAIILASDGCTLEDVANDLGHSLLRVKQCYGLVRKECFIFSGGLKKIRRDREKAYRRLSSWVDHKTVINLLNDRFRRSAFADDAANGEWS